MGVTDGHPTYHEYSCLGNIKGLELRFFGGLSIAENRVGLRTNRSESRHDLERCDRAGDEMLSKLCTGDLGFARKSGSRTHVILANLFSGMPAFSRFRLLVIMVPSQT